MDNEKYRPISAWGYIGYEILFAIPVVGLIVALILAITSGNQNVKNYARSKFCLLLLVFILVFMATMLGYTIPQS